MVKYNVHLTHSHYYDMRIKCQYSVKWTVAHHSINFIRKRNAGNILNSKHWLLVDMLGNSSNVMPYSKTRIIFRCRTCLQPSWLPWPLLRCRSPPSTWPPRWAATSRRWSARSRVLRCSKATSRPRWWRQRGKPKCHKYRTNLGRQIIITFIFSRWTVSQEGEGVRKDGSHEALVWRQVLANNVNNVLKAQEKFFKLVSMFKIC